jgi:hypothetical protein
MFIDIIPFRFAYFAPYRGMIDEKHFLTPFYFQELLL